ncbi:MAG TPA: MFS transporter [Amycolatopsis sp.]|nr:MFS transporter [Amycolatopsis sp.]
MTTEAETGAGAGAPPRAWGLVLVAVVGAEFMLQLDGTIVAVALPDLQARLGLGIASASWVVNGFFLAFGGLLLLAGRLGDVLGYRRVFLAGIGLVTVASLVAGLAPNFPVLLIGRILQGAGAAVAGPTGLALLTVLATDDRRQRAFGLYSTVTGLGASAGMVLGGVLTWAGEWRWSLLVNVPVGLAIVLIGLRVLGGRGASTTRRPLALPSALLVVAALTALVYGLVRAADHGWGDTWTLVPLILFVVLVAAVIAVDSRTAEPLLPKRVFANRARVGGFVNLLLLAAVLTSFLVYSNQYLHTVLGLTPLQTGLAILPFGLAILASTQFLTKVLARFGLRTRAVAGLVLVLGAVLWLSRLDGSSSYAADVLPQIIILGVGVGVAIVPFNMIVLSTAAPEDTGVTAGLLQTSLTVGGSIGTAVLLIPFTSGSGHVADTISDVFLWGAAIAVVQLLVAAGFWFGPGTRTDPT